MATGGDGMGVIEALVDEVMHLPVVEIVLLTITRTIDAYATAGRAIGFLYNSPQPGRRARQAISNGKVVVHPTVYVTGTAIALVDAQ